jgi:hypothetical protein
MAEQKYAKHVVPMKYIKGRGGANAKQMTFMSGDQLGGLELNYVIGVYDETGDWAPDMGAHDHPFDECLVFFGYGEDFSYLGADMSLAMGKEYEVHKFSVPTVVAAPANLPHCPLITEKVYDKFGHFHLACSGKYAGGAVKKEGTTNGKKYDYLFKTMKVEKGRGRADAKQIISIEGAKDLAGVPLNFKLGIHHGTGEFYPGAGACVHPYDSVVAFFGRKTDDISYLGAEITIELGKEHEKYTFDKPTAIWIPKGMPHFPVVCNHVEHTYTMAQVGLSAKYSAEWEDASNCTDRIVGSG